MLNNRDEAVPGAGEKALEAVVAHGKEGELRDDPLLLRDGLEEERHGECATARVHKGGDVRVRAEMTALAA